MPVAQTATNRPSWQSLLAQILVWLLAASPAWSNPTGANVVAGNVQIETSGSHLTITAGDRSIIEWTTFNIPFGQSVEFIQPCPACTSLNRTPTLISIGGDLRANGTLYLLGTGLIRFGPTANVDVHKLVAAAGQLSNADFLAGIDRFTELSGSVENYGVIEAGAVQLIGASAANHGQVFAPDGAIWLLAGDEVTVLEHGSPIVVRLAVPETTRPAAYAVENTGVLDAGRGSVRMAAGDLLSLAVRNTGTVRAQTIAVAGGELGRVQIEGVLDASSASGPGGEIEVRGDLVSLASAELDASGATGGGRIHVGGGWQGEQAPGERNARLTVVDSETTLRADATEIGDGGEIVVWSDGNTRVQGVLSARGGEEGGNGGRVETSAKRVLDARTTPDLAAPSGEAGSWLLDPSNIRIVETVPADIQPPSRDLSDEFLNIAAAPLAAGDPAVLPLADDSEIAGSAIASALGRGFSVILSTQNIGSGGNQDGDITFAAPLDFSDIDTIQPDTRATLTLRAANDIRTEPGIEISDATPNDNLALSIDFLAGDASQPANPNAPEGSLTKELEIGGDIRVGGGVSLVGDRIVVAGDISAGDTIIDEEAPDPTTSGTTILLQARRDGMQLGSEGAPVSITTGNDEIGGGSILLRSSASNSAERNDLTAHVNLETNGGALVAVAEGGDLTIDGTIDTTTGTPDDAGLLAGGLVLLDANLLVTNGETNPDLSAVDGGDITVRGGSVRAGGGGIALAAQGSIDVSSSLETSNQSVVIGVEDIAAIISNPETPRQASATGGIESNGGAIQLISGGPDAVRIEIGGVIDATASGPLAVPDDDGSVLIAGPAQIDILDGTEFRGNDVQLAAGTAGTGNLTFGATGTLIDARTVALQAGNGYTAPDDRPATEDLSRIEYGGLEIGTVTNSDLLSVSLRQDAAVGGTSGTAIPGPDRVHFRTPVLPDPALTTDLTLAAHDGTLELVDGGSDARDLIDGRDFAELEAASGLILGSPTGPALDVAALEVRIYEAQTIDADFANNASGLDRLTIETGVAARPASGESAAIDGSLHIDDAVGLVAETELTLHAGVAGVGNLIVGNPDTGLTTPVSLTSDQITLRAGDGSGGVFVADPAELARVEFDAATPASIETIDFSLRQDAAIGGPDGTPIPQVDLPAGPETGAGMRLALRSDDSVVTLEESARSVLEDRHLAVVGTEIDASAFSQSGASPADPLLVRSLDLGHTGNFAVDDELLRSFDFTPATLAARTSELVLRAGLVQDNVQLTFVAGTVVEGDTIRLIASDGPGGNQQSSVSTSGAIFRRPVPEGSPAAAPDAFVLEQDTLVSDAVLPGATQFGDESGSTLPMQLAIRSADNSLVFSDPASIPIAADAAALQILGGETVEFTTNGDLSFARDGVTPGTEIRAQEIRFTASNSDDTARVLLAEAEITFAGHDTAADGADAGDFLPFPVLQSGEPGQAAVIEPDLVVIDQDATIDETTLPIATFVGEPTVYELQSQNGSIELSDPSRVAGTKLVLRLDGVPDTGEIDPVDIRRIVLGGGLPYEVAALDIDHNRGLSLAGTDGAGIDVRATGLVTIAAASAGQPDENLSFAAGSSIAASDLILQAGISTVAPLADPAVIPNGVVELNGLQIDLTSNPDALFTLTQDGSLGRQNGADPVDPAFAYVLVTDDGSPDGLGAGTLSLRSRRGDLGVEAGDIRNVRNVILSAGGFLADVRASVTLRAESGDLALDDPNDFPHLESLNLAGDQIRLVAEGPDSQVLANSDKLTIFGTAFATPTSLTLEQTAAFSNDTLVGTEQFDSQGLLGLPYTLRSPGQNFVVDAEMADRISVFDVTLDSTAEEEQAGTTIRLDASLADAPLFAALQVIADDIRIETPYFETLGSQQYRGDTTLAAVDPDPETTIAQTTLSSLLDILFLGSLDAATDDANSLTVIGGRDIQFAGDVGGTNRIHDLEVDFASSAGRVEFGSAEQVDTAVRLGGDLRIRSIDPIAYLADGTITPITRTPASGTFSDPFNSNLLTVPSLGATAAAIDAAIAEALEEGFEGTIEELTALVIAELVDEFFTVPIEDELSRTDEIFRVTSQPYVASILKQSNNTLDLDIAGDIEIGRGEKWTAAGTLDIDAAGEVAVGDLTAQIINLSTDRLTIVRRAQSNLIDNDLRTEADAGVDWIANEFNLEFTNGYTIAGSGRQPVVGTPSGDPITAIIGGEEVALPFSSAAIYPDQRELEAGDLVYNRGLAFNSRLAPLYAAQGIDAAEFFGPTLVLDARPRGPAAADFSQVLTPPVPRPVTTAPLDTAPVDRDAFLDIGIVARAPTPNEIEGREHAATILDDASHAWPVDREIVRVASPRLEEHAAGLAADLFEDIFGPAMENAPAIREVLATAIDDYREHTGARRVLGFELRRFLRNRPSTQFAAHQLIDRLDRLFSQHRASGLVPGEFVPVQRTWIDLITPDGIEPDELAQAIHPSRYVRGSDVLDIFGQ